MPQETDRARMTERLVIRPLRRHRIVVVDDRQNSRANRNILPGQALWVTLAVPSLVMAQNQQGDGVGNGTAAMISAPTCGWIRIFWNSSWVNGPGFDRICSGTASFPMSWSSAAVLTP